ncbi:MAG: copper homeostasis protein CutC [Bacteroidetes bacterium]|nr:copper homeostasis protein CutC [Bacteroidota bacterium]
MIYKLEVVAFDIESCRAIERSGAHRIELCDNPAEGGTTASYGFIEMARKLTSIDLFPIIRPRGGDFLYSDDEFEIMKSDVKVCKDLGCDGIVIGILNKDGSIDKKRCSQLVNLAYPLGVTFHRAFDRVNHAAEALEDVIDIGCERILTSGLYQNASDGLKNLTDLVSQADGRIIIMPGSGIRSNNIEAIAKATKATQFHSSARRLQDSGMEFISPTMNENLQSTSVNEAEIKLTLSVLQNLASPIA